MLTLSNSLQEFYATQPPIPYPSPKKQISLQKTVLYGML